MTNSLENKFSFWYISNLLLLQVSFQQINPDVQYIEPGLAVVIILEGRNRNMK